MLLFIIEVRERVPLATWDVLRMCSSEKEAEYIVSGLRHGRSAERWVYRVAGYIRQNVKSFDGENSSIG